jgi:predicted amidohydrolase
MRTTIDIEDDVLTAVKERARLQGVTLGVSITQLIRRGLEPTQSTAVEMQDGIPTLMHARKPTPVTAELVRQMLEED